MTTRAKFKCKEIKQNEWNKVITMEAVTGKNGENGGFTKHTPNGKFEMTLQPEGSAFNSFVIGNCYYFDISEAPNE